MPTEAVTGTKQMKTTSSKTTSKSASKSAKSDEPAASDEPAGEGTQQGHHRRRNWTDDKGVTHVEEQRPGSKAWQEVKD